MTSLFSDKKTALEAGTLTTTTKVTFIVPVYNEQSNIAEVIKRIQSIRCTKEIVIVDDGSDDLTLDILKPMLSDSDVIVHESKLNLGKGTAIRIGLKYATGDIIAIHDGDLEYDVRDYEKILALFTDPEIQVVYGSRFKGKIIGRMKFQFWVGNHILRILANLLYRAAITDEATAYKAFRTEVIKGMQLKCRRFEFCPEVTAKVRKKGIAIHEVPITYNPRSLEQGKKIRAKDGLVAIWTLIRLRFMKT